MSFSRKWNGRVFTKFCCHFSGTRKALSCWGRLLRYSWCLPGKSYTGWCSAELFLGRDPKIPVSDFLWRWSAALGQVGPEHRSSPFSNKGSQSSSFSMRNWMAVVPSFCDWWVVECWEMINGLILVEMLLQVLKCCWCGISFWVKTSQSKKSVNGLATCQYYCQRQQLCVFLFCCL